MIVLDMEMPTSCAACPCADDAVRFCRAASDKDKYVAWLEKRLMDKNDSD